MRCATESNWMLSADQREHFERHGFVVLKGMFTPQQLSALRPPTASAFKDIQQPVFKKCVVFGNPETDEDPEQIIKLEGLGRLRESAATLRLRALHGLCRDPRVASVAAQLLGPGARLMKDKFVFKAAGGGGGFPPHQDMTFIYSRVCTNAVNFGIAFNDADASNGSLQVVAGMHARLRGRHILPVTETKMPEATVSGVEFTHVNTREGDCIAFSAWLLHRSSANRSPTRDRGVYYVTYGAPAPLTRGRGCLYDDYYELYDAWIASGYAKHSAADGLLGAHRPRPSLIPRAAMGARL